MAILLIACQRLFFFLCIVYVLRADRIDVPGELVRHCCGDVANVASKRFWWGKICYVGKKRETEVDDQGISSAQDTVSRWRSPMLFIQRNTR